MTKTDFLSQLSEKLAVLPEGDRNNVLEYYSSFISSATDEDGEALAISKLGTPGEVASEVLTSYVKRVSHAPAPNRPFTESPPTHEATPAPGFAAHSTRSRYWWLLIVFGIIAAPAIIGVTVGIGGGLFGLFIGLWSVVFAIAVAGISLIATGAASLGLSVVILFQDAGFGLLAAGFGLVFIGLGIYFLQFTIATAKWAVAGIASIARRIRRSTRRVA